MRSLLPLLIALSAASALWIDSRIAHASSGPVDPSLRENILAAPAGPRALVVGPRIPVNPPQSGYHGEVMAAADPESAENLLVCGFRANPRTGSGSEGYVYNSSDGGKTWRETLVDAESQWVSEESCTFGPGHQAYFAAGISDTSGGVTRHEYGHLHLYRSPDGGRSWETLLVTRFMDFTSLAVDEGEGPRRGALYIFSNSVVDGTTGGWAMVDKAPYLATLSPGPELKLALTNGSFNSGVAGAKIRGKFPQGSVVLSDGTALAIFAGDRAVFDKPSGKERQLFSIEMGTSRDGGKTLTKSTIYESIYPPVATGLAVNNATDEIYVCWTPTYGDRAKSELMLATSRDKGQTWSVQSVTLPPHDETSDVRAGSVSLAVNKNGVLGFMWYGPNPERVYFGLSLDDGSSITSIVSLTPGAGMRPEHEVEQADDRRLFVYPPIWKGSFHSLDPLKVLLFGPDPWGVPSGNALIADRNGVFHPVWNEMANGATHLWTREVSLRSPGEGIPAAAAAGLESISDKVVWHISDVRYDRLGSLLTFDITVTNKSVVPIAGPIMVVQSAGGAQAELSADNADNGKRGEGAAWELQSGVDALGVERSTEPRTLSFRTSVKPADIMENNMLLEIPLEIYGRPGVK
jgi:hypothetical protein